MIIKWSLFCEDVQTVDGKGNLIGVVEDFVYPTVPFGIGQMAVVLGTELTHSMKVQIGFVVRLTNTREVVFRSDPTWNDISITGKNKVLKIVPLFVHNIVLPEFGKYNFEVFVNGQKAHTNSFRLIQLI